MRTPSIIVAMFLAATTAARAERDVVLGGFGGFGHRTQPPHDTTAWGASVLARLGANWGVTALYSTWEPQVVDFPGTSARESVAALGPTVVLPLLDGRVLPHASALIGVGQYSFHEDPVADTCADCKVSRYGEYGLSVSGRAGVDLRLGPVSLGPELQVHRMSYRTSTAWFVGLAAKVWL